MPCHTYAWTVRINGSQEWTWVSCPAILIQILSCDIHEWVMSCRTYARAMHLIWSHVCQLLFWLCDAYRWAMHMYKSYHTCQWVMSHESCHTATHYHTFFAGVFGVLIILLLFIHCLCRCLWLHRCLLLYVYVYAVSFCVCLRVGVRACVRVRVLTILLLRILCLCRCLWSSRCMSHVYARACMCVCVCVCMCIKTTHFNYLLCFLPSAKAIL